MIYEIAMLEISKGAEDAFESAVAEAEPLFRHAKGCRSMCLQRSIERPSHYRLVVGWETVADHEEGFRGSEAFTQWRALVGPHFAAPPVVEHVATVLTAF